MTLVEMLRNAAQVRGDKVAFSYLRDGEVLDASITYGELDRQARAIATTLASRGATGERVLLLYPPGLDFVSAVFGCLYAGAVATPMFPPHPAQLSRAVPRLQVVVDDANCRFALAPASIVQLATALVEQFPGLGKLAWIAPGPVDDLAGTWREPAITGSSLAMLQYTSGSTAAPKGVMLAHDNLLANSAAIRAGFRGTESLIGVSWLPMYHDMGLIGAVLTTVYIGGTTILMSPLDFLKRPMRWLQAISSMRATHSGGPNFAFDLCVQRSTPEQRAAIDLSSWEVAFSGAERIRVETLDRFANAFEASGFRRSAFYPCYGLAEATLIVTGAEHGALPVVDRVDARALEDGRAVRDISGARALVGCGQALPGTGFAIVDPETCVPCDDGHVGEIWAYGPSIAMGYWNRREQTTSTFHACLRGDPARTFLRTGDLGYARNGELFVTSRLKDLIIIRGKNHYPEEIEISVEGSHPALRPGCSVAFSADREGEEQLVVAAELDRRAQQQTDRVKLATVRAAIRQAISERHDLRVHEIVLLRAGCVPKTSSGKVQRRASRECFLNGTFEPLVD